MRTSIAAALAALSLLALGACKKKEEPTAAAPSATAPATTSTAKPCSGMASAKDCESCCNPKFFPAWKFTGGKCDCGAKK